MALKVQWHLLLTILSSNFLSILALGKGPLSEIIKNHDTINYNATAHCALHKFAVSSMQENQAEKWPLSFWAFNRHFQLILQLDTSVAAKDAVEVRQGVIHPFDASHAVVGQLADDPQSHVFGSVLGDGVFRGAIWPGTGQHYYVEHAAEHFNYQVQDDFHSVIFSEDHIVHPPPAANRQRRSISDPHHSGCALSNTTLAEQMAMESGGFNTARLHPKVAHLHREFEFKHRYSRATNTNSMLSCSLFLQADHKLYEHFKTFGYDNERIHQEIRRLFTDHVQAASAIYRNTYFRVAGTDVINTVNFRVNRVLINSTESCNDPLNPFCREIDVTNFLNLNAYLNHDAYCLAYIFTYRDFTKGTLGLAWVGEPSSGGICSKYMTYSEGGREVKKSMNTGVVTLLNYGQKVPQKVSFLTFAHEMGHNFGAAHDADKQKGCLPDLSDPNGNYIMYSSATSGNKINNNRFSACSVESMSIVISKRQSTDNNCFEVGKSQAFCGNQLTEGDEQCDCGFGVDCKDKCCVPRAETGNNERMCKLKNETGMVVLCSPSAGQCCTSDCTFVATGTLCKKTEECTFDSYCLGTNGSCPAAPPKKDGTPCQANTKVCRSGECTSSICSLIDWQECFVTNAADSQSEDAAVRQNRESAMCYVSCRANVTGAPCISTFTLSQQPQLQQQYPELDKLLRNISSRSAIALPPGAPCDEYRGYCDTFLVCRNVNADGPLLRLKNLLFNQQSLTKVRDWIVSHWWAVILMCLGVIIFMALFVKVCAVHTPSSNPNARKARKLTMPRRRQIDMAGSRGGAGGSAPLSRAAAGDVPLGQMAYNNNRQPSAPPMRANDPPPPYYREEDATQPPAAHGKGKRKGHRQALEAQAAKYQQGGVSSASARS